MKTKKHTKTDDEKILIITIIFMGVTMVPIGVGIIWLAFHLHAGVLSVFALPFILSPLIVYCCRNDHSEPGWGLISSIMVGSMFRHMMKRPDDHNSLL